MMPEHLYPKTYWERRCELAEAAVQGLARLLSAYVLPPAAQEDLTGWAREWDRLVGEINVEFSREPDGSAARVAGPLD